MLIFNYILIAVLLLFILGYLYFYYTYSRKIRNIEYFIVDIFLQKLSKIPAVIEVMRPYVVDQHWAFDLLTHLHSESIIYKYNSIYALMEHNAKINDQYSFLMRLSIAIPELQKDVYFLYIRDFVMAYDTTMKRELIKFTSLVKIWNRFVFWKKFTIVGYLLPGREILEI